MDVESEIKFLKKKIEELEKIILVLRKAIGDIIITNESILQTEAITVELITDLKAKSHTHEKAKSESKGDYIA